MSKIEAKQINNPKRLKGVMSNSKKESIKPVVLEAPVELDVVEEKIISQKSSFGEKIKSLFERKISGAIKEIFRRKELDESVEKNLSEGLENDENFVAASNKIDKKRNWFVVAFNNLLNKKTKEESTQTPYTFDDIAMQGMKELEEELSDSFTKNIYGKLGEINKRILLDHLVDNPISRDKSEIIELPTVSPANDYVVAFSDNGFLLQQIPKGDVETENDRALYNLISPDGTKLIENSDYVSAFNALEEQSTIYQKKLAEEFAQQEIIQKNLLEREKENAQVIEEDVVSGREEEMNKLMDAMLEDEKEIALNKEKEQEFSLNYEDETPETIESDNKEPINAESVDTEPINAENVDTEKVKLESDLEVTGGIDVKTPRELIGDDFNSLSEGQQKFVKEALLQFQLE